jgi:hypothetical protein
MKCNPLKMQRQDNFAAPHQFSQRNATSPEETAKARARNHAHGPADNAVRQFP